MFSNYLHYYFTGTRIFRNILIVLTIWNLQICSLIKNNVFHSTVENENMLNLICIRGDILYNYF